jgi:hypothetical protein
MHKHAAAVFVIGMCGMLVMYVGVILHESMCNGYTALHPVHMQG